MSKENKSLPLNSNSSAFSLLFGFFERGLGRVGSSLGQLGGGGSIFSTFLVFSLFSRLLLASMLLI